MPLFDYRCSSCGKTEEKLGKHSDATLGEHCCDLQPERIVTSEQLSQLVRDHFAGRSATAEYRLTGGRVGTWKRVEKLHGASIPPSGRYSHGA